LAEVLVTIGIAGLLMALMAPAIQSSRQSSRRLHCTNNLRQIGVALQNHETVHRSYPRGGVMPYIKTSNPWRLRAHAPHLYLLPYLDETNLFKTIDLHVPAYRYLAQVGPNNPANQLAQLTTLPVFLCPSDPGAQAMRRNNYRANIGTTAFPRNGDPPHVPKLPGAGAFYPVNRDLRPQHFGDGLSNTIAFSEKLVGDGSGRFDPRTDVFSLWQVANPAEISNSPQAEARHVQACASLRDPNPPHDSSAGQFWFFAGLDDTWYNHLLTPNHGISDCGGVSMFGSGLRTARSAHPGGVNCLLMDGSCRFVASGINLSVWQAMATHDGGETFSLD
jgi:type II secretory pathway pseudopilin PulG